jgi:tetratricopeptide (TPR) repeat protein
LLKGDLINAKIDIDKALKISNKDEIFYAERGNYFSLIGEFEKAKKDFKQAEKINPNNRRLSQYITEDMIRQGKWDEAIINAELACKTYKNDTVSYEQLGRMYFFKNDLQKSLNAYTHSAAIMDFNESDKTIYPDEVQVNLSDIYLRISELFKMLNQSDLGCEAIKNANSIVVYETRPDRQKMIREIKEKLKNCPN